jgi:hypothetical protein
MNEDARKYILELFKIVSTDSVLVVTSKRKLVRLYCPFKVICNFNVPPLVVNGEYDVEAVKMTLELKEVYIISGNAYFIWYFTIRF